MISPLETLEVINKRLKDHFGLFENGESNWKIFWSEDILEKRLCDYSASGVELLTPEVREVKKFSYIKDRFVLCRLVPVPGMNSNELLEAKVSYEPIWTFEDNYENPVAPDWEMSFVIITNLYDKMNRLEHGTAYKQNELDGNTKEAIEYRVGKLMEAMFGNENKLTDSLRLDTAVGYGTRQRKDWTH